VPKIDSEVGALQKRWLTSGPSPVGFAQARGEHVLPSPLDGRRAGVEGRPREEPQMRGTLKNGWRWELLTKRMVSNGGAQNFEKPCREVPFGFPRGIFRYIIKEFDLTCWALLNS